MSELFKPDPAVVDTVDRTKIRERIQKNAAPVTDWAASRLLTARNADSCIGELYADYEEYCHREKCPSLGRKTWIAAMKLADFETQSGGFTGLKLKSER